MQIKGLVKFFTVVLILISLYQLSFTVVVKRYESKIKKEAQAYINQHYPSPTEKYTNNPALQRAYADTLEQLVADRIQHIEDSTRDKVIYNTLINKYTYEQAKEQELNLGLDLQGGMNVVLEVSVNDLIRSMANNSKDPALNRALELASQRRGTSGKDFVTLFYEAWKEVKPANERLAPLFINTFQNKITYNTPDDQVINIIRNEANDAIKRTYNVLLQRIDKFGVAQPNINLDLNRGIITVDLPGVHNPDRVRKYLQATAKLEFWETYQLDQNFYNTVLVPMNNAIAQYLASQQASSDTTKLHTGKTGNADTSGNSLRAFIQEHPSTSSSDTSNELIAQQKQNPLFAILHQSTVGGAAIGSIRLADTPLFNYYLSLDVVKNVLPRDLKFLYGSEASSRNQKTDVVNVYAIKTIPGSDQPMLDGSHVVDARADVDSNGGYEVVMRMDNTGARIWKKMTGDNIGKPIAIVLDDEVVSAPVVQTEIAGGNSSITGRFTAQEAQDLANILQTGKLPVPAHIVQEQVVGPTLGKESIQAGIKSFVLSFVIIFILMLVYFNNGGMVANIALVLNLLFTVGVLAALGATLTMPGIAGLVLTIGMAVDTNVIIFERIKEELYQGKGYLQAIADGYKHSYAPVLDAHVTMLLTAIILYYFGLGPVRGFATTQILGILLSLFTGILVSRLVEDFWTNKKRHFEYFTRISRAIFRKAHFKFIENRKYAYIISGILMLGGISSFFHGFNEGVEFKGGRSYDIQFTQPHTTEEIAQSLQPLLHEFPIVKTLGTHNVMNITTSYLIDQSGNQIDSTVQHTLYTGLKPYFPAGTSFETFRSKYIIGSQTVLPTISEDLKRGAFKATIFAVIIIFLYILIRFRRWQYSLGTILSLVHDVLVILFVFSYFRKWLPELEINQQFIAAILTVIGYSMNDTIIVFDRVREYFREMKGADKVTVIDKAINHTLTRTIMTSLTVFITILVLFLFGGESIRGFSFAMLVGIITGTYSSIFIASPVLVDFDRKNRLHTAEASQVKAPAYSSTRKATAK
ncbi:MAG: protein translocase subunit SecDF [Thermoflavifilum sp.]|nr:protein translocase subunit SecDF [Thermoflavifilum sp.]